MIVADKLHDLEEPRESEIIMMPAKRGECERKNQRSTIMELFSTSLREDPSVRTYKTYASNQIVDNFLNHPLKLSL